MHKSFPVKPLLAAIVLGMHVPATLASNDDLVIDIEGISFDELINTTITSASKRTERLQDAAAAVYVLTNEDIRRAHVTNVPDALRLVPGVEVTQTSSSSWGISIRGFNTSIFANKLLVLIDGRAVYDPLFSGTFWQVQDVMLEDIDRIEVIRGSGGTLWGSNAVNGVINITTKSAKDTQGGLVVLGAGNEERVYSAARYGIDLGNERYLRFYAKFNERDESWNAAGAADDWRIGRGGFRYDSESGADHFTLQGDIYDGRVGPVTGTNDDTRYYGSNVLARWTRTEADGDATSLQVYWDNTDFDAPDTAAGTGLEQRRDTLDLEFQRTHAQSGAHRLIWGLGYRFLADDVPSTSGLVPIIVEPEKSEDTIWSLFAQDEISLADNLHLTLGTKFENNSFTGWEVQPNARISWAPSNSNTWWAAVSRAVRTPSRIESDWSQPAGLTAGLAPNDHLNSEELRSIEIGNRRLIGKNLQIDATAFVNDYDDLIAFERTPATGPLMAQNSLEGRGYGFELDVLYRAAENWQLRANYTWLRLNLETKNGFTAIQSGVPQDNAIEDSAAAHRINLVSTYQFAPKVRFDTIVRFVDNIPSPPTATTASTSVDAYTVVDLGMIWDVSSDLSLELSARNLLDNHHPEAAASPRNEIQQSVFGKATWNF